MADLTAAERKELEALRAEHQALTEKVEGVESGTVRCLNTECDFGEAKAKFTKDVYYKYFKDQSGNLTDRVENSTTYWHLRDHAANCPDCSEPLNQLPPGSYSVFSGQRRA